MKFIKNHVKRNIQKKNCSFSRPRVTGQEALKAFRIYRGAANRGQPLTKESYTAIVKMLNSGGKNWVQIAQKLSKTHPEVNRKKVTRIAKGFGFGIENETYAKLSAKNGILGKKPGLLEKYLGLRKLGLSSKEAAKKLGINRTTVTSIHKTLDEELQIRLRNQSRSLSRTSKKRPQILALLKMRDKEGNFLFPCKVICLALGVSERDVRSANKAEKVRTLRENLLLANKRNGDKIELVALAKKIIKTPPKPPRPISEIRAEYKSAAYRYLTAISKGDEKEKLVLRPIITKLKEELEEAKEFYLRSKNFNPNLV